MRTNVRERKHSKGQKRGGKRLLSCLLTAVMAVAALAGIPAGNMEYVHAEEGVTLHNPRVTKPMVTEWEEGTPAPELQNPRSDSDGIVTWDCVYFGSYPQSDATGQTKEPIKWRVLSVNGDDAFLVADKNLDVQRYNDTNVDVTWETCTMRSWLNGYGSGSNVCSKDYSSDNFLDCAFTASEQNAIKTTTVVNADNAQYGTAGGNATEDKLFLLSYDEVRNPAYGVAAYGGSLLRKNTAYVAAGGTVGSYKTVEGDSDDWWLRSPGNISSYAADVDSRGAVNQYGCFVHSGNRAVCPALHLNLSSSNLWRYAGTVSSDEAVEYDCVYFGSYPQSDATGQTKEPIKWRVLSVNGDDAFLVADRNLDVQRYNDTNVDVTWETCTMRSWLNGYGSDHNVCSKDYSNDSFLGRAFTLAEQNAIRTTTVVNADNPRGAAGGNATEDKLFLLSYDEVTNVAYGLGRVSTVRRRQTAYVLAGGTIGWDYIGREGNIGRWWLRSPGYSSDSAAYVNYDGEVIQSGSSVNSNYVTVCPALHLNLSSSNRWSYAGTVSSTDVLLPPECTEHQWDAGVVTKEATATEDGEKTFTCTVCKETKTEKIEATGTAGQTPSVPSAPGGQQAAPGDNQSGNIKVQAVQLSGTVNKLAAGKKTQLSAAIAPDNASDKSLTWESSNSSYAAVDSSGQVTAKAAGAGKTVTITATARDGSNVKAAYKITVMKDAVKSIKLDKPPKSVKAGKSVQLKAVVKTTGKKANKALQWESSNTKYATVSKNGKVKTKKAGKGKTVKITVRSTDGSNKKASIKLKIK